MIHHEKYDKIQVDNIVLAAKLLIEEISFVDEHGETKLYSEIDRYKKTTTSVIKAINILKHQIDPM